MADTILGFFRLLLRPRGTMRRVLSDDPNFGVMSIAVIAGITAMLRSSVLHGLHPLPGLVGLSPMMDSVLAYGIGATPEWPLVVSTIGIAGGLFGVLGVYLGGLLLWLTGLILGGRGRYSEVRSALAWAFVPYSWLLPLWVIAGLLNASHLRALGFSYESFLPPGGSSWLLWIVFSLDYGFRLLALVWLVLKLSVAHRYALWRAMVNVAVACGVLFYLEPHFHALGF